METYDATIEEYASEIEIVLDLVCSECAARFDASDDIRKEEEHEAPWGPWARRQAIAAKSKGWFVRSSKASIAIPAFLCPACARRRGLTVTLRDEDRANQAADRMPRSARREFGRQ